MNKAYVLCICVLYIWHRLFCSLYQFYIDQGEEKDTVLDFRKTHHKVLLVDSDNIEGKHRHYHRRTLGLFLRWFQRLSLLLELALLRVLVSFLVFLQDLHRERFHFLLFVAHNSKLVVKIELLG